MIVGKTNTPAFGLLGETKNRLGPEARNPRDPSLTTGGSSGGSAAAVAAGLVPGATGTDSAGSITAPSSMCGAFGIKPTLGRIPTWPIPDDSMLFLTHGPIAATVADAVALLEVMAGHDARDPMARRDPLADLRASSPRPAARRRLPACGWRGARRSTGSPWTTTSGRSSRATARALAELGAEVDEAAPRVEHPMELYFPIFGADTRRGVLPVLDPGDFYPESTEEASRYPALTAEELHRAAGAAVALPVRARRLLRPLRRADHAWRRRRRPSRSASRRAAIGGVDVEPTWMTFMPFSSPWNLGTHPTASIPAGAHGGGQASRCDGRRAAGPRGSRSSGSPLRSSTHIRGPYPTGMYT